MTSPGLIPEPDPPNDTDAEKWCLGGMMSSAQAMAEVTELLEPDDFYRQAHLMIYRAMVGLFARLETVDPITVKAELEQTGELRRCGGAPYLHTLYSSSAAVFPAAVVSYAEIIRDKAARRKVLQVGWRLVQRVGQGDYDLSELVTDAQDDVAKAVMTAADLRRRGGDVLSADAFMAGSTDGLGAVIPGLLDHQDRAMIIGGEGDGKSTLGRQLAVATSAGVHPFTHDPIPPQRCQIIDAQNPPHLLRRELVRHIDAATAFGRWDPARLAVTPLTGGVDLTTPAGRMRVAEAIREFRPDLVVAGPVDKMYRDKGQGAEELHSQVTDFWDDMTARYEITVWLEHHAPKGGSNGDRLWTPKGWGGYMGWPEFGFTLARVPNKPGLYRLGRFRGDRERGRCWPVKLEQNTAPLPSFPWHPVYETGTLLEPGR